MRENTDWADDDARVSVKIRAIRVIRVINRDAAAFSYAATGMGKLCALCLLFGEKIPNNIAKKTFINIP